MSDRIWDGADLGDLLRLEPLGDDRFRAPLSEANLGGEIFGGQYLGQAVVAGLATVEDKVPHSLCAYFLRAARADVELELEVERTREGRRFAHRQIVVRQAGALSLRAEMSLVAAGGAQLEHRFPAPDHPDPECLVDLSQMDIVRNDPGKWAMRSQLAFKRGIDLRPVDDRGFGRESIRAQAACWIRARTCTSADPDIGYAVLAYLSDYWGNFASRLPFTADALHGPIGAITLNHALWFHGDPGKDWLLFDVDSPACANGTGFNRGLVYDRSGRLVASQNQEALLSQH